MKAWRFTLLFVLLCASACTPAPVLPAGITRVKGIDPQGLQLPLWSPDGKKIAAAYNYDPLSDFPAMFGPKRRHDIVVIDAQTWDVSIVAWGNAPVGPEAWLPDHTHLVVGVGSEDWNYAIDAAQPLAGSPPEASEASRFSSAGRLSPDLQRIATISTGNETPYIIISKNHLFSDPQQFKVPVAGQWFVSRWSPDGKWLTLLVFPHNNEHTQNIYLLHVASGSFIPIKAESGSNQFRPQISPDGELVAYTTLKYVENKWGYKLIISRLDHRCQWTMPLNDAEDFAWSPDGQRMFIVGLDGVYLADLGVVLGSSYPSGQGCK